MNDAAYYNQFYIGLVLAGVIVFIAALLLIMIWMAAKRILRLATAALSIVIKIKENTLSIWALLDTNQKATNILSEAETIESRAGLVATAFHETEEAK
jgi:hypothetical protein